MLAKAFREDVEWRESASRTFEMSDASQDAVEAFLRFLYMGSVGNSHSI